MSREHLTVPELTAEEVARFWSKVSREDPDGNGCWPWQGLRSPAGYGRFKVRGLPFLAHRISFALQCGNSPGYSIGHRCGNPPCCNPEHLFDQTPCENAREASERGRLHTMEKPAKPHPNFPLFAHASGQWAKKIRGRMHYFGGWADPGAALENYRRQADDLHVGRTPRPEPAALTLKDVVNHFLNFKKALLDTGELAPRTWGEYKATADLLIGTFGKQRLVSDLGPDDFARLRNQMAERWGPVRLGNAIQRVRCLFKYAADAGLIDRAVRFGPGFARPSAKTLRLHRARQGLRMFEAGEIRRVLDATSGQLRAMLLLGINCGYGNADCGTLPLTGLDLDGGWVAYHRPKTGITRRCPLWPETVQALREVLAGRPAPKDSATEGLVFVTKFGQPWAKTESNSPLSKELRKLLDALGIDGGRNFYCLRHTFETIGGESRDQVAVDYLMGHSRGDMASVYRERISDGRLRAVTDHVREWLFGNTGLDQEAEAGDD
jgi:integrase